MGGGAVGPPPEPYTSNSVSETPHWVARAVDSRRTYRPEPATATVCRPPVPATSALTVVQEEPLAETCRLNVLEYAVSQASTTEEIVAVPPRSTCSHCGSLNALDQRVPALPSTAFEAGKAADSVDEAVAGRPWESSTSAALAPVCAATTYVDRTAAIAAAMDKVLFVIGDPSSSGGGTSGGD